MGPQLITISTQQYNTLVPERDQARALISSVPEAPSISNKPPNDAFKVTLSNNLEKVESTYVRKKGDAEATYDRDRKQLENEFKREIRIIESEFRRKKAFATTA